MEFTILTKSKIQNEESQRSLIVTLFAEPKGEPSEFLLTTPQIQACTNNICLDNLFSDDYSEFVVIIRMIDSNDRKILEIIQNDGRIANAEIARQVGLAPSAVLERLRKMEERGVILGYAAEIESKSVGCGLTAFVFVKTKECSNGTDLELAKIPEVLEIHDVAGDDSYLLKVKTKNTEELGRLLREKLKPIQNVLSTRTTIVLQTIKETMALPLDGQALAEDTLKEKNRAKKRANQG